MNPYEQDLGNRDPLGVIEETPERLRAIVDRLSDRDFERAHGPDKWTIAQLLEHLAQSEMIFGVRVRMALTVPGYVVQPFDQNKFMAREPKRTGRDAFAAYYAMRRWNLPLYRSLSAEERQAVFTHPERGRMTVADLVGHLAGHELRHLAQIEKIAAPAG